MDTILVKENEGMREENGQRNRPRRQAAIIAELKRKFKNK